MENSAHPVYLIDGSGYIFRAFYAVQPLTTKDGFPTNALFGFIRMLLRTLTEASSDRIAIVFDAGRETFRNELYPEYKANRTECPPELVKQMPYFREVSRALGLPVLEQKGFEADDIIATLADRLAAVNDDVVIVSGDKDLMQLVTDRVSIWDTMKDQRYGPAEVTEKFGVPPEQVVEVLALMGDTSDNVPGVDGVGPKTAAQLIQKYQSVEGVIAHLSEVKDDSSIRNRRKIVEAIESDLDQVRLCRKLVEVDRCVPLKNEGDSQIHMAEMLQRREIDGTQLRDLLNRFEFTSLLRDFPDVQVQNTEPFESLNEHYHLVLKSDFETWVTTFVEQSAFAFDLETTSLAVHEAKIIGISICWNETEAYYIPIAHKERAEEQVSWSDFCEAVGERFLSANVKKCGQNIKYDISVFELNGLSVAGIEFDSMVAAYLLNPDARSYNLTVLAREFLNRATIEFEDVTTGLNDFSEVPLNKALQYAGQDAHYAWLLREKLQAKLRDGNLETLMADFEVPLIPVLARMERNGIGVDLAKLKEMSREFEEQLKQLEQRIFAAADFQFNINSPKQLADVLFAKLAIPTKGVKKTKTGLSTDSSVLEKIAHLHPLPQLVLDYRLLHKLKSTYTDTLANEVSPVTHRVHTKLNQTITATGRLSSSEPNLQNIPIQSSEGRRIRSAFVPGKGNILFSVDYSQIELRLLAHLSGDENLIHAFVENDDIHSRTAREILGISANEEVPTEARRMGKTINFGIVYGMGAFRLARELGIPVARATEYINNYFNRYPRVKEYFKRLEEEATSEGVVHTLFGRKRIIAALDTSGRDQGFALRAAINAPLQGTAADIIKLAMIKVDAFLCGLKKQDTLVLQIHDELLLECEDKGQAANQALVRQVVEIMEHVVELAVPLRVDAGMGYNWNEAQS